MYYFRQVIDTDVSYEADTSKKQVLMDDKKRMEIVKKCPLIYVNIIICYTNEFDKTKTIARNLKYYNNGQ